MTEERKPKVLIADDEEGIRSTLSAILSSEGYSVYSAGTADELFSFLRKEEFDLILLDIVLPDADGLSLIPEIKKVAPMAGIILITAYASLESAISALNLGTNGYLPKPIDIPMAKQIIAGTITQMELERKKKELEDKLRYMAERYRSLLDNLREGIYISTPEGRFKEVNEELVRIDGYSSKEELLKVNIADLYVSPEEREKFKKILEEKGAIKNYEIRYRRKDGKIIYCLESCVAIRDETGRIIEYQGTITDITERKQLEMKLEEYAHQLERKVEERTKEIERRKEELQTIINTMNEGLAILNRDLTITGFNRKLIELSGYEEKEVLGRSALNFFTEESKERIKNEMSKKRLKGLPSTYEAEGFTKDGRRVHLLISAAPLYNEKGEITGSVAVLTEITHLKEMEKKLKEYAEKLEEKVEERTRKLKETELRYSTLFQNVREGVFIADEEGRIIEANPGFISLFGYQSKKEVIRKKVLLNHSVDRETYQRIEERIKKEGEVSGIEASFKRNDGTTFHSLLFSSAIREEGRRARRFFGTIIDITERKLLEKKLKEALDYVENIIESSHDIIITLDLSRRIVTFNRAAELAFGYLRVEVLGQSSDILYAEKEVGEKIFKATLNKGRFEGEVVNKRKNGAIFYSYLSSSCLKNRAGEVIGVMGVSHDITKEKELAEEKERYTKELERSLKELKKTQDQLIQAEKMASLGQLLAGIAHELNTPISFISANLRALTEYQPILEELVSICESGAKKLIEAKRKEEGEKALSFLRENKLKEIIDDIALLASQSLKGAERMIRLISDLRKFSRMDRGELISTDVNACLDTALALLHNEIKYKAEVIRDYGDIPQILSAAGRLEQVFVNLLLNAAQAIKEKGKITITTRKEGENVVIKISDTGCGISKTDLPHIFDPFFTTKPRDKGTGLGLSIVYNIVKQHGGDIKVESRKGVGTTFTITLPKIPPTPSTS